MEAQETSRYGALVKLSRTSYDPATLPRHTLETRYTQQMAARNMAKLILMSLGVGVGAAGLRGLKNILKPRPLPYQAQPYAQNIEMPVPDREEEEEAEKQADFDVPTSKADLLKGPWKGGLVDIPGKAIFNFFDPGKWQNSRVMQFLGGRTAVPGQTSSVPFSTGIGWPLAALAAVGGFGLTDKLIAARQKKVKDEELEEAKEQYQQMLRESFSKSSSDQMLDAIADGTEKCASSVINPIAGGALAYALIAAALSGKLSYDYFKGRSEEEITEEAIRERAKQRAGGGMLPAYVTPKALPAPGA